VLRFVVDENFNNVILRGLLLRQPALDLLRIQDIAGMPGAADPVVLAWAADAGRIILTHDLATMPHHAYARVAAGQPMFGVFATGDTSPLALVIDELLVIAECSEHEEWIDRVWYLPLLQ
jgi:predicted nuclease of predicted toxin-antitoxin system